MILEFTRKLGVLNAVLVITAVSTLGSALLYSIISLILDRLSLAGVITAIIIPFVIAPPTSAFFLKLIKDLDITEGALRESEERYRNILEAAPDSITITRVEDGRYLEVNKAFCELSGYSREEVLGRTPADLNLFVNPGDRERFLRILEEKGELVDFDIRYCMRDGTVHDTILSAKPLRYRDQDCLIAVATTITERKRAEEALRKSELKFRTLIDSANDSIFIMKNYLFVDCNRKTLEMFCCNKEDIMGRHPADLSPEYQPDERISSEKAAEKMNMALKGTPQFFEWTHLRMDGTPFDTEVSLNRAELNDDTYLQAIVRDITERKQAEEALKAEQARIRALAESAQDGIAMINPAGEISFWNQAAERIFGYSPEEAIGKDLHKLLTPKRYHTAYYEGFALFRDTGQGEAVGRTLELEARRKDGREIPMELSLSAMRLSDGWNAVGIMRDITKRKRTEEESRKLKEHLDRAQKMEAIGTLAGGIAHNFNNVLMGIQGRASLMIMDKDSSDPDYEHLKGIEEYVRNAAELTRDLLGFARGGRYEVKPTDLNTLISHENRMFGRTKKEIRVHGKYEKNLWTVEVDQGQIRQVFLNLYVNAWQAMPGGGDLYIQTENVILSDQYLKSIKLDPGPYVKISVTDTGVGMDDATREKIFDPFFSTKELGQGSGLGLASVYGIIENHGGFIHVSSAPGSGTTFEIYLPASQKDYVREAPGPVRHGIQYGGGTVLLVDDEEMILEVGRIMLERLGYRVLVAESGEEALDIYEKRKQEIDLVILDIIMPGMGGGETYDLLQAMNKDVKVLLSSGYSIDRQAKDIMDRGCEGFIQKPFAIDELSRKVKEVLGL